MNAVFFFFFAIFVCVGSSNPIIEALISKPSYRASLEWSNSTKVVDTANGRKIRLSLSYRFICAPNNYGANCSKTCTPRNDQHGHFTCDADGNIVCLPGWGGQPSDKYCENRKRLVMMIFRDYWSSINRDYFFIIVLQRFVVRDAVKTGVALVQIDAGKIVLNG